jgi:hypothetical protein
MHHPPHFNPGTPPVGSRMPVPYQPVHPTFTPAPTPTQSSRQTHRPQFIPPRPHPGIPPHRAFPQYPGMINYMPPPHLPMGYGIPIMVPVAMFGVPFLMNRNVQEEADEEDDFDTRERAFPPAGPRLFQHPRQRGRPGGNEGRRAARPSDRAGGFEVHHPDGAVEVGQEDLRIEEMSDDEHESDEQGKFEPEEAQERSEFQRQIGCNENSPISPSSTETTSIQQVQPTPSSEPNPVTATATPTPKHNEDVSFPKPKLSPGTRAPVGTPEAQPPLELAPEVVEGSAPLDPVSPTSSIIRDNSAERVPVMPQEDFVSRGPLPDEKESLLIERPAGTTKRTSSPEPLTITSPSIRSIPAVVKEPLVTSSNPSTPILPLNDETHSSPQSASLSPPEPAQVLDRLLEITGLSARQFMVKLERGEFHMSDGQSPRNVHAPNRSEL